MNLIDLTQILFNEIRINKIYFSYKIDLNNNNSTNNGNNKKQISAKQMPIDYKMVWDSRYSVMALFYIH